MGHWGPETEAGEARRGISGKSPGEVDQGGALQTAELDKLEGRFRGSSRLSSSPPNMSTYPRICKCDLLGKSSFF